MVSDEFFALSKMFAAFAVLVVSFKAILVLLHKLTNIDKNRQASSKLTSYFLQNAYKKYASHKEKHMDIKQYIKNFPAQVYLLHKVNNFADFYLDNDPDVIKSRLMQDIRWEENLTQYIAPYVRKNSNVLDIGAHIGTHTIYFSQLLAGRGTVWAFEPQKKLFIELNANLSVNKVRNVKTFRYAVGERSGTIEMNPATEGNEGATSIGGSGDKAEIVTIDSLGIEQVSFIKIDVEGYEDQVLDGALNTIKQSKPVILVEIMCSDDRSQPSVKARIQQTLGKLKGLGYKTKRVSFSDYLALPIK